MDINLEKQIAEYKKALYEAARKSERYSRIPEPEPQPVSETETGVISLELEEETETLIEIETEFEFKAEHEEFDFEEILEEYSNDDSEEIVLKDKKFGNEEVELEEIDNEEIEFEAEIKEQEPVFEPEYEGEKEEEVTDIPLISEQTQESEQTTQTEPSEQSEQCEPDNMEIEMEADLDETEYLPNFDDYISRSPRNWSANAQNRNPNHPKRRHTNNSSGNGNCS